MSAPKMTIIDAVTGETTTRNLTAKELAELEADKAETEAQAEAKLAKAVARAALLTKLGITEQEAQLLLGS